MNKYITKIRREITGFYSNEMGKKDKLNITSLLSAKRILIVRPNHRLGNQLLITPIVQEVVADFPQSSIDIFAKGYIAPILFKNYPNINGYYLLPKRHFRHLLSYFIVWIKVIVAHYDLVINTVPGSSSGTLVTRLSRSKNKLYLKENTSYSLSSDYRHNAKKPVLYLRSVLEKAGLKRVDKLIPPLNVFLNHEELERGKIVLDGLVDSSKPTICLYTYATGLKCFSKECWNKFYNQLNKTYPDYNILEILPKEHVSSIDFKCPSYYSLDLREIAAVIANTRIFIGTDSGMMHLASASGIPVVGLFNITDEVIYGPYGNRSFSIDITNLQEENRLFDGVENILTDKNIAGELL